MFRHAFLLSLSWFLICISPVGQSMGQSGSDPIRERLNMALLMAVFEQDKQQVVNSLDEGADINGSDYLGKTALMYAMYGESEDILIYLLAEGADINAVDASGNTVLMHAILGEQRSFVSGALPFINNINYRNYFGYTALIFAAQQSDLSLVQELVAVGADIEQVTERGTNALMHAAAFGQFFVADYLLYHGTDVAAQAEDGSTALHLAAFYGHNEVSGLLMDWGAFPEAVDGRGNTALMAAIYGQQLQTTWYLVESGAHLHTVNEAGLTPLSLAVWLEDKDIVELLLGYDFREHERANKYRGALAYSYYNRNYALQRRLQQHPGVEPSGLYFSELSLLQGLAFSGDEILYRARVGVFESRYRFWLGVDYLQRFSRQSVLVPERENFSYRFFEQRSVLMINLQREFVLFSTPNLSKGGLKPGISWAYTFSDYRGTSIAAPGGSSIIPGVEAFIHLPGQFTFSAGYNWYNRGHDYLTPHWVYLGVSYRFSFFTKRNFRYRPALW